MLVDRQTRRVRFVLYGRCAILFGTAFLATVTAAAQTPVPPTTAPGATPTATPTGTPSPTDFFKLPQSGTAAAPVAAPQPTATAMPLTPAPVTGAPFVAPASNTVADGATSSLRTGSFSMQLYHAVLDNAALIGAKYGWPYPAFLSEVGGEPNLKFLEADGLKVPSPPAARLGEYVDLEANPGDGRAPATYQVYVPPHDPQRPLYGVFGYITASPKAAFPAGFAQVFDKYRLIGVCPDNAGNPITTPMRQWKVMDGITAIRRKYAIDPARVYVGGTSGGGRMASQMVLMMPEVFSGGYYMVGVNWYSEFTSKATPALFQTVKQRVRHVLMTGSGDFNLTDTKNIAGEFDRAGFTFLLQNIDGHKHAPPTGEVFDQGIQFLDAPLMENPEVLFKKSALLAATQPGNGWLGLSQAASRAPAGAAWVGEALAKAAELKAQYAAEVEVCRAAVESKDATALMKVRASLKKWGTAVDDQLVRLDNQLKPSKK